MKRDLNNTRQRLYNWRLKIDGDEEMKIENIVFGRTSKNKLDSFNSTITPKQYWYESLHIQDLLSKKWTENEKYFRIK